MNKAGLIIGIHGKIGSGKDTIAREIIKEFPEYDFKKMSFGYNVKKIVSILTGIDMRTILSRKIKTQYLEQWHMTVGEMFQQVGTNALRDMLSEDVWIISLFNNIKNGDNIIITDVRFFNEAESVRNRGGFLIKIIGDPKKVNEKDSRDINHKSETELDNYEHFDIVYDNIPPIDNIKNLLRIIQKDFNL